MSRGYEGSFLSITYSSSLHGIHSDKLTWQAGKWTRIEDVFPIKHVINIHGNPQPSFLGVISPMYWGLKTFIFHGFGVQGMLIFQPAILGYHEGLREFFFKASPIQAHPKACDLGSLPGVFTARCMR